MGDVKGLFPASATIAASCTPPWLLQDGNFGVGVFPESKTILASGETLSLWPIPGCADMSAGFQRYPGNSFVGYGASAR